MKENVWSDGFEILTSRRDMASNISRVVSARSSCIGFVFSMINAMNTAKYKAGWQSGQTALKQHQRVLNESFQSLILS